MPTGAFNICCPRDCVSRHNGGTSGAPLKPLRVDSALRYQAINARSRTSAPPLNRSHVSQHADMVAIGATTLKFINNNAQLEKYNSNSHEIKQTRIVVINFRLIWNQTEFRLVQNKSENRREWFKRQEKAGKHTRVFPNHLLLHGGALLVGAATTRSLLVLFVLSSLQTQYKHSVFISIHTKQYFLFSLMSAKKYINPMLIWILFSLQKKREYYTNFNFILSSAKNIEYHVHSNLIQKAIFLFLFCQSKMLRKSQQAEICFFLPSISLWKNIYKS